MKCADCGASAVMVATEDGVTRGLCPACAEALTGVPGISRLARGFRRPRGNQLVCPHCKTTAEDAVRTGVVGCPLCYVALLPALQSEMGLAPMKPNADAW